MPDSRDFAECPSRGAVVLWRLPLQHPIITPLNRQHQGGSSREPVLSQSVVQSIQSSRRRGSVCTNFGSISVRSMVLELVTVFARLTHDHVTRGLPPTQISSLMSTFGAVLRRSSSRRN